jgi:hypothetical protein
MDARSELMPNGLVVVAIVISCDSRNEAESTQALARLMKVGEVEVRQGRKLQQSCLDRSSSAAAA